MATSDANGRLFGRLNVVDAALVVALVGLIPLGYAAYLLFRTPLPVLARVEPDTLTVAPNMRITVRGSNFRPYMRVSIGTHQGMNFLFNDTTEAQIDLRDVPPGVYDVVLYDYAQERDRLPKALTVKPSELPDAQLVAVGMFGNVTPDQASHIRVGFVVPGVGQVAEVGRPVPLVTRVFARPGFVEIPVKDAQMVPVAMRMACYVRSNRGQPECVTADVSLQPKSLLFLDTPLGRLPFQIDEVRAVRPPEEVAATVRLSGSPDVLGQVRPGDVDLGDVDNALSSAGTVRAVGPAQGGSLDVRMTLQAQRGSVGWVYRMSPLRLGGAFTLRTPAYELSGTVVQLSPLPAPSPVRR